MKIFSKDIKNIQPSQLYISSSKLSKVEEYLDSVNIEDIDPLPIKKIGENIFFTDGHTRAFALMKRGRKEVKVYWDEDNLDWFQYLICCDWCNREGIRNISDLEDRILDDKNYQELWNKKCDIMQKRSIDNMDYYLDIQKVLEPTEKLYICELILRNLPNWFGIEDAIKEYILGVRDKVFFVAYIGDIPIGFISIKDHNEFTSEIYVLGVLRELHGRGIGKKLIKAAEDTLIQQNKKILLVKTLGESHPDENYKKTREFYKAVGFYPLEEFTEIWGKENPCLLMAKALD